MSLHDESALMGSHAHGGSEGPRERRAGASVRSLGGLRQRCRQIIVGERRGNGVFFPMERSSSGAGEVLHNGRHSACSLTSMHTGAHDREPGL